MVQSGRSHRRGRRRGSAERPGETRRGALRPRRTVKPPEQRRKDILDAALELFASRGFAETTVGDIADVAGVATGTVYIYFPSKEHVLLALHARLGEEQSSYVAHAAAEGVEGALAGHPEAYGLAIDHLVDAIVAHTIENRRLVEVCARYRPQIHRTLEPAHERELGMVVRVVEEGVRLGLIHTSDPEMTAHLLDSAISETLEDHLIYGDPPDLDRLVAATKELLRKALAPEPDRPAAPRDGARGRRRGSQRGRKTR